MAHYTPTDSFGHFRGALSKKKENNRFTITRIKSVHDPLTGEKVGYGAKEIYLQERRDYKRHPLTAIEQTQRTKWREACRLASQIIHDTSHPRYMELYHRWRAQLSSESPCMQFPNFVRAAIVQEPDGV